MKTLARALVILGTAVLVAGFGSGSLVVVANILESPPSVAPTATTSGHTIHKHASISTVVEDMHTGPDAIHVFNEDQEKKLTTTLSLDHRHVDGVCESGLHVSGNLGTTNMTAGSIPPGWQISSHYVHVDKPGTPSEHEDFGGRIVLDKPILGVIVRDGPLDATDDDLGRNGTAYPTGNGQRGLEYNVADPGIDDTDTLNPAALPTTQ
jgi:hypothetical protein